jgi:hypothetical protein
MLKRPLHYDLIALLASVIAGIILFTSRDFASLIHGLGNFSYANAVIAGALFTSAITTGPATAALYYLAGDMNIILLAFLGALGAVVGDFIIYNVLKKTIHYVTHESKFRLEIPRKYNLLAFLLAGAIIASPLPDELGFAILGASKIHIKHVLLFSYVFNFIGILIIGVIAGL